MITITIKATDIRTVVMGPILIPMEESSKKRINPAPPIGMGPLPFLLFLRLDCLLREEGKFITSCVFLLKSFNCNKRIGILNFYHLCYEITTEIVIIPLHILCRNKMENTISFFYYYALN